MMSSCKLMTSEDHWQLQSCVDPGHLRDGLCINVSWLKRKLHWSTSTQSVIPHQYIIKENISQKQKQPIIHFALTDYTLFSKFAKARASRHGPWFLILHSWCKYICLLWRLSGSQCPMIYGVSSGPRGVQFFSHCAFQQALEVGPLTFFAWYTAGGVVIMVKKHKSAAVQLAWQDASFPSFIE